MNRSARWFALGLAIAASPAAGEPAVVARAKDGDTLALTSGEVVRLVAIDAPELKGARCGRERVRALQAKARMTELVGGRRVQIERHGRDRFRRTLATVSVDGSDVGDILLAEGLATLWRPGLRFERPGPWC